MARTKTRHPRPPAPALAPQPALLEVEEPVAAPVSAWLAVALAVLLVLLVVAAFAPALGNDFVSWDDDKNFLENFSFRGLGWPQIYWAWTSFQVGVYQPLAWMMLEAQYVLFGLKPWGYHLVSLILYAINTVVLFLLTLTVLSRCRSGPAREDSWALVLCAALAVAFYAVHPLRTEVVVWASCQPYLPCAFFSMLAVLAYLRAFPARTAPRLGWLAGTFLLFAGALLSKAVAVSLPLVLLILDVYPLGRLGGGSGAGRWFGRGARRVWLEKVPFAGLSLIFMGLAIVGRVREQHLFPVRRWGIFPRIGQACYGIWFYVIKTLLPANLTAYYAMPERMRLAEPPFLLSLLGTVSLSVVLFRLRRRRPELLAVWLSYLVILAPNLGLVRIANQIAADRYSYMAMMGGVVLLAAGLGRIWGVGRRAWPIAAVLTAASLGVLVVLIMLTRGQCRTWRTSEILWTHTLSHGGSRSHFAHNNLAAVLLEQGRVEGAIAHCTEALRLNPDYAEAHNNLGSVLYRQERLEEARAQYAEAIRLNPNLVEVHNNLGLVLSRQGWLEEAKAKLAAALRIDSKHAGVHNTLGLVLYQQGRLEEALAQYVEAIRLKPDYAFAHNNLGIVLNDQGRLEEARAEYAEALRLDPDYAEAHNNLGSVLDRQGRSEEARAQYAEAIRLNPKQADAHTNLGSILYRQGRLGDALAQYAEALRIDPKNAEVHNNRAMIWATYPEAKHRDGHRAVESATRACELTGWKNAGYLDTLAAAYAEGGDFEQAVHWQRRAIDLLTDEGMKADFRSRLELYQQRQPYREAIEQRRPPRNQLQGDLAWVRERIVKWQEPRPEIRGPRLRHRSQNPWK